MMNQLEATMQIALGWQEMAEDARDKAKRFAAAFFHACDEEGTYFGLGEEIYNEANGYK